jgi:hypothetical protein
MEKQREQELLASFRNVDDKTQMMILAFTKGQAEKQIPKRPHLRVILGGRIGHESLSFGGAAHKV